MSSSTVPFSSFKTSAVIDCVTVTKQVMLIVDLMDTDYINVHVEII